MVASTDPLDRPAKPQTSKVTLRDWIALRDAFGSRCAYCGERVFTRLAMEHVAPLSRGGEDHADNILPSCPACNSSKGDLHPLEWVFYVHGLLVNGPNGPYVPTAPKLGRPRRHWMVAPKRRVVRLAERDGYTREYLDCGHWHYGHYTACAMRENEDDMYHSTAPAIGTLRRCYDCIDNGNGGRRT